MLTPISVFGGVRRIQFMCFLARQMVLLGTRMGSADMVCREHIHGWRKQRGQENKGVKENKGKKTKGSGLFNVKEA